MKYLLLLLSFSSFAQTQYEVVPKKYWITDSDFEEKIKENSQYDDSDSGIVVIEFWAEFNQDNCFREWSGLKGVTYHRVDVALAPLAKKKYRIRMAPTVLVFKDGIKELSYKAGLDLEFPSSLYEIQSDINSLKKENRF
jgi:thiol-disulfide isomerase/thioredoxin